jgi:PAS domain S-box-containing protein
MGPAVMIDQTKQRLATEEPSEIEQLRRENTQLLSQVAQLVKAETKLYRFQEELDSRIREYQKLYELSRKFSSGLELDRIFDEALGFIINDLEYERAIIFIKAENSDVFKVHSLNGYYDKTDLCHIEAQEFLSSEAPFSNLLGKRSELLICRRNDQQGCLEKYRSMFLMDEFLVYPVVSAPDKSVLLVAGNSRLHADCFRRVGDGKADLLGIGNLVGLLSTAIENSEANRKMFKAFEQASLSETRYRNLFENAAEGIYRSTVGGDLIDCNPSAARILGFSRSPEQLAGPPGFLKSMYLEPGRREELIKQLFERGSVSNFEVQLRKHKSRTIWVSLNARLVKNSDGASVIEGFMSDINTRKMSEIKLKETREFLDKIINSIPGPIFVKDENHKWVMVNDSLCRMIGQDRRKLLGKSDYDFFSKKEADVFWERDRIVLESGCEDISEELVTDASGFARTCLTRKVLYINKKKERFIVGIITDISEIKHASEALRKSEEKLSNVLDHFPGIVYWKDIDSVYIGCNKNFCRAAGLSASSEVTGKTDFDMPWGKFMAETYREEDRQVIENRISMLNKVEPQQQQDGSTVWLDTSRVPLHDSNANVIGVLVISNDITERRKAEELLQKTREELSRKEKLAILGQLSGSVSHELRNPLGIINNAVYLLKMINPEADQTTREYLDIIKHEIGNSQRIINDMLGFARNRPARIIPLEAGLLIEESLAGCSVPEEIKVVLDIPPNLPLLSADREQIKQVLHNIVVNAVQAMPEGGEIRIGAKLFTDPESPVSSPGLMEICVSDSGVGIEAENMSKMFQPLFTTKTKGIGLGLVVCKNLVEANRGKIMVQSEVGKGTELFVRLPVFVSLGDGESS